MKRVLVITDDPAIAEAVGAGVDDATVEVAPTLPDPDELHRTGDFDFAFVEAAVLSSLSRDGDHRESLERLRVAVGGARTVVMTAPATIREAVEFVREGAADYLTHPIHADEVRLVCERVERRERMRHELHYLRNVRSESLGVIRTRSEAMRAVLHKVRQVAPTRSTVLLTGETGTGKSLLARVIHANSNRADRQFISVHCGAIPDTLLESELFGHERGAFTGADRRRLGKFEIAHGGTLFLDEIATVSAAMQVKLLQVLQDRTIQRLGGERSIEVDVRILTATNNDLGRLTQEGEFRSDLYYRLNVFPIEIPPLRHRLEDVPLLVESFLERLNTLYQKDIQEVHPEVMAAFAAYHWPGNVRELENLMERAVILEPSRELTPGSFPDGLITPVRGEERRPAPIDESLSTVRRRAVDEVEKSYLTGLLTAHAGRIGATAEAAGITPRQLHKLMVKHRLRKESFRSSAQRG